MNGLLDLVVRVFLKDMIWRSMEITVPINQGWRNLAVHLHGKTESPFSGMFLPDANWY